MLDPRQRALFALRAMVVEGSRISWEIPHARERAAKRDVPIFEAERIVRAAKTIIKVEVDPSGYEKWRVGGADSDGRPVDVVVKPVGEVLRVVTVIRTDE